MPFRLILVSSTPVILKFRCQFIELHRIRSRVNVTFFHLVYCDGKKVTEREAPRPLTIPGSANIFVAELENKKHSEGNKKNPSRPFSQDGHIIFIKIHAMKYG